MAILMVPISLTLSPYTRFYELRNANGLQKIYTSFLRDYASCVVGFSDPPPPSSDPTVTQS